MYMCLVRNNAKVLAAPYFRPSPSLTFPTSLRTIISAAMATPDISKPIAFCEHLQLSALGVQPASISFQVSDATQC